KTGRGYQERLGKYMNDVNFDLSSIDFLQKTSRGLDGEVRDCAHQFEKLCSMTETENAHFQNDCQREEKKIHESINNLRSEIGEIEQKKKEALSKKQKEQPKPNPPSVPSDCTPEQKNAIAKAYHQRVSEVEEQNAKIRKQNEAIDAYAKKCDEAIPKIEEIIAKLQNIEMLIKKEADRIRAQTGELAHKVYSLKTENRFIASSCASFNYALERAYEMAQRIEMLSTYSMCGGYDMSRQFTIKNTHTHFTGGSIFTGGNSFSSAPSSSSSGNTSPVTSSTSATQASNSGEITVTEKKSADFFNAINGYNKVAMPSGNIRFLGGKSFNAKMNSLGYTLVTQPNGSIIDKNGMVHWEKI
ncbi:MAG: hypothetical protein IJW38_02560, partial [Clostridia bacterium]|nr:hypothetical protein [Clostridia bacterium]